MLESIHPVLPLGGTVVEVPKEVKKGGQKGEVKRKAPSFDGTLLLARSSFSLKEGLMTALALLVRVLALTARILLLLSGFVAAALLLAGLLARVLILLARILVLTGHQDLPC
jgi:hypothetical protein